MTAIRTLLTVVVAAALLGASLPAVDDARTTRTDARLDTTATRVTDVAAALVAADDPAPADQHGASRTVVVTVPSGGFADARTDYLSIGGLPNASQPTTVGGIPTVSQPTTVGGLPTVSQPTTVGYRVAGQPPRQVDAGVRFETGEAPLVLGPGRHALRLSLVRTSAGTAVRVRVAERDRSRANVQIRERLQRTSHP